jgi:hypothetical protein
MFRWITADEAGDLLSRDMIGSFSFGTGSYHADKPASGQRTGIKLIDHGTVCHMYVEPPMEDAMIPVVRAAKRAHDGRPRLVVGGNYELMPGQLPGRVSPPPDFWPEQLRSLESRPFRNEMPALRELLGEPTWPVPVVDWDAVHAGLGFQLPADYREFMSTHGPGTFLDIRIAGPGAPGEWGLFGWVWLFWGDAV